MGLETQRIARETVAEFANPNDGLAYLILITDLIIYGVSVHFAVASESVLIKVAAASLAGFMIAQLFVIGHDAAHQAYVSSSWMNAFIGRLTFLPSLHNYSLWIEAHNKAHHSYPNVKGMNSWWPLSYEDFQDLSGFQQIVYRIYRSAIGFGPYYIFQRWLPDKFFPRKHLPESCHYDGWKDFILLFTYIVLFACLLIALANSYNQSAISAIVYGAIIPFIVWNYAMGLTIYQHHTNPKIRWYETLEEWRESLGNQGEVTVYVKYPKWYNFITHYIYVHPTHHVNTKVPIYNLTKAEDALEARLPNSILVIPFNPLEFIKTINTCKLYDYKEHKWLYFDGNPSTNSIENANNVLEESIA